MSEYLEFVETESKPKTKVYSVESKCGDCTLGEIKWYPNWRYYCFFPTTKFQTVHSNRCLKEISEFITNLNKEHKQKRKEVKTK